MQEKSNGIIAFLIIVTALLLCMISFVLIMLYLYQRKQTHFKESLNQIKSEHEKIVMTTQLEVQEHTFQNLSREIHDNISLSLSLAKLHLMTLDLQNIDLIKEKTEHAIQLMAKAIGDLTNISRGLNANTLLHQGLIKAVEEEIVKITTLGLYNIQYTTLGTPLFLSNQNELIIFRIIQESLNNIIKHAAAKTITVMLNYKEDTLVIIIIDDGIGFAPEEVKIKGRAGLLNMQHRISVLGGNMTIASADFGTELTFYVPITKMP